MQIGKILIAISCLIGAAIGDGVIYTRWGRTACPLPATTLYTGIVAGSNYNYRGGGAEFLCVNREPDESTRITDNGARSNDALYGAQYYFPGDKTNNKPFSHRNNGDRNIHGYNPPCAVCYRKDRSVQVMIPGKSFCTSAGMTTEYAGFLVSAGLNTWHRAGYICLDEAPEVLGGGTVLTTASRLAILRSGNNTSSISPPYGKIDAVYCTICTK